MTSAEQVRLELLEEFRQIARDRVETINLEWIELEKGRNPEVGDSLMRVLHTLKGEARMMTFPQISQIVHRMEGVIGELRRRNFEEIGRAHV